MDGIRISARLAELLGLTRPPVALALADERPAGVSGAAAGPSACSFWRQAEQGVFYASAMDHFNCPVGAMVMGFELPPEISTQLSGLVESMCGQGYLSGDEPAKIPVMPRRSAGILYGPLAEFPAEPDMIVMWLTARQAMIFNEAGGSASWTGKLAAVSGRPGCAALSMAMAGRQAGLSFGCAGMRTFTMIPDQELLAVLPGDQAEPMVQALAATVDANTAMMSYYRDQQAQFT